MLSRASSIESAASQRSRLEVHKPTLWLPSLRTGLMTRKLFNSSMSTLEQEYMVLSSLWSYTSILFFRKTDPEVWFQIATWIDISKINRGPRFLRTRRLAEHSHTLRLKWSPWRFLFNFYYALKFLLHASVHVYGGRDIYVPQHVFEDQSSLFWLSGF